jgi:hypothetical protein
MHSIKSQIYKLRQPLTFLILFQLLIYFVFRLLDKSYQTWDSAGHIGLTIRLTEHYKSFFSGGASTLHDIITESNYYPPLIHLQTSFLNLIFGYNTQIMLFWIFVVFLISLIVFYKLLLELNFSKKLAFSAVFIYSLFPLVADQARLFHLESPMILAILLCYLLLLRSKNFSSPKYTFAFFLAFAGLQLIKWYGFLYLVVPVLYVLYKAFIVEKNYSKVLVNCSIGSVVFLVLALPWYIINFKELTLLSKLFSTGEFDDPKVKYSVANIFFYLRGTMIYQTFLVPFVFFVTGLALYFKKNRKIGILLIAHCLLIYVVFTLIENKNQRYIFGLNLVFAFGIAYLIEQINRKWVTYFVFGWALLGFFVSSFNNFKVNGMEAKAWGIIFTGPFYDSYQKDPKVYAYKPYKPPIDDVFKFIVSDANMQGIEDIGITPLVDYVKVSSATLEMVRGQQAYDKLYMPVPYYQFEPFKSDYEILKFLRDKNVSYVIVPEYSGPDGLRNKRALEQSINFMRYRSGNWFELIKTFENNDNDLQIYRIKKITPSFAINTCQEIHDTEGGDVTVEPLASLVLFTGNFAFSNIYKPYEQGTLNIAELTNYSLEPKTIEVVGLPKEGFSICHRMGTKLKIKSEVAKALMENTSACGATTCNRVVHTKLNIENTDEKSEVVYMVEDFVGRTGMDKFLRKAKFVPFYEDEYKLEDEVFVEYNKTGFEAK